MENKHLPKTREELEQEFKELTKGCLYFASIREGIEGISLTQFEELKELFYNILKRIN